jgi:guanine deaminase
MCSKTISLNAPPNSSYNKSLFANKQLSVPTLFYLATQGGADVCALGDRIGSLNPGKAFDALYVSTRSGSGNPALWPEDLDQALGFGPRGMTEAQYLETLLERFLFTGDDRNIRKVYVQGHWIGGSDKPIRLEASELN